MLIFIHTCSNLLHYLFKLNCNIFLYYFDIYFYFYIYSKFWQYWIIYSHANKNILNLIFRFWKCRIWCRSSVEMPPSQNWELNIRMLQAGRMRRGLICVPPRGTRILKLCVPYLPPLHHYKSTPIQQKSLFAHTRSFVI